MNYIRNTIRRIPPRTLIYLLYGISFWLVAGSLGQFAGVYPELFSGEEVTNFW